VGFQTLDLNLNAYEIIKDVFLFPFPKVLGLYLFQPINIRIINASVRSWDFYLGFIWIYLCGFKFELDFKFELNRK
jgi:hypothetical protein